MGWELWGSVIILHEFSTFALDEKVASFTSGEMGPAILYVGFRATFDNSKDYRATLDNAKETWKK